jgi:hypothetical protein
MSFFERESVTPFSELLLYLQESIRMSFVEGINNVFQRAAVMPTEEHHNVVC